LLRLKKKEKKTTFIRTDSHLDGQKDSPSDPDQEYKSFIGSETLYCM